MLLEISSKDFRFHNNRLRVKFTTAYNDPGTKCLTFGAKSLGGLF